MATKKTKCEKMSEAVGDAYDKRTNKIDILCYALWTMSKGTRYKNDAEDIIKACNPKFFSENP